MNFNKQTAVVVIAAYNEAGSVRQMMDSLFNHVLPTIKNWNCKVLVVDDTSPDKTYEIVAELQKIYPELYLVNNPVKLGMGNAIAKGFHYAIDKLHADVVMEFDCDFQHPPEDLPKLLIEIDNGYDFVIGSRKIKGGSVPASWGLKRKFFTYVGGFTSRFILFFPFKPFFQVTDPTTGLRASRVKGFVDQIDLDHMYTLKFGYKIELLFRMIQLKAKFKEIPLQFGLRETGESKIAKDTAKDILFTSIKCRWYDEFTQKFLKFGTVGFVGYLFNAFGLILFAKVTSIEWLIWLLATEVAIISNFTLNNIWTFSSQKINGVLELSKKFFQFNLSSVGAIIIQSVVGSIGVTAFGLSRQILLPIIIVFLVLPYNWLMYNKFIWKKK
ncbi:MAG: glycosyltransferase [Candidatus Shapirobacteria bacterium]